MRRLTRDSKYLVIAEGELRSLPPKTSWENNPRFHSAQCNATQPGHSEWRARYKKEERRWWSEESRRTRLGVPTGETKVTMAEKKKTIREFLGEPDWDKIKARLDMEEDEIVKMVMADHVATILENHGERDTLAAKKELMVYLKAKPVSRVEHKVTEADEAWAEEIDVDALTSGKAEWKPKPN